jgi:hypothetical protein
MEKDLQLDFIFEKQKIWATFYSSNKGPRNKFYELIKESFSNDYPDMQVSLNEGHFVCLLRIDFLPNTAWEERSARYREMVDTELERILPKLAATIGPQITP